MTANEQDVVLAFRQAVEEELRQAQSNAGQRHESFVTGDSLEESVRKLIVRHEELESEVALLRTIILKLISDPVDENNN